MPAVAVTVDAQAVPLVALLWCCAVCCRYGGWLHILPAAGLQNALDLSYVARLPVTVTLSLRYALALWMALTASCELLGVRQGRIADIMLSLLPVRGLRDLSQPP